MMHYGNFPQNNDILFAILCQLSDIKDFIHWSQTNKLFYAVLNEQYNSKNFPLEPDEQIVKKEKFFLFRNLIWLTVDMKVRCNILGVYTTGVIISAKQTEEYEIFCIESGDDKDHVLDLPYELEEWWLKGKEKKKITFCNKKGTPKRVFDDHKELLFDIPCKDSSHHFSCGPHTIFRNIKSKEKEEDDYIYLYRETVMGHHIRHYYFEDEKVKCRRDITTEVKEIKYNYVSPNKTLETLVEEYKLNKLDKEEEDWHRKSIERFDAHNRRNGWCWWFCEDTGTESLSYFDQGKALVHLHYPTKDRTYRTICMYQKIFPHVKECFYCTVNIIYDRLGKPITLRVTTPENNTFQKHL